MLGTGHPGQLCLDERPEDSRPRAHQRPPARPGQHPPTFSHDMNAVEATIFFIVCGQPPRPRREPPVPASPIRPRGPLRHPLETHTVLSLSGTVSHRSRSPAREGRALMATHRTAITPTIASGEPVSDADRCPGMVYLANPARMVDGRTNDQEASLEKPTRPYLP